MTDEQRREFKDEALLAPEGAPEWQLPAGLFVLGTVIALGSAWSFAGPAGMLVTLGQISVSLVLSVLLSLAALVLVSYPLQLDFGSVQMVVIKLAGYLIFCDALGVLVLDLVYVRFSPELGTTLGSVLTYVLSCLALFAVRLWLFSLLFELEMLDVFLCTLVMASAGRAALELWSHGSSWLAHVPDLGQLPILVS